MKFKYDQKLFDSLAQKYEGIIKTIENNCDCIEDKSSYTVLINKIYYEAYKFYLEHELIYKYDSIMFSEIKKQKSLFVEIMKKFLDRYEQGENSVIYDIKDFLKEWLKNPYSLEDIKTK